MALTFGPRLQAFVDEPLPITVGTTRRDGSVQMNPVWYEYRDGQIWLNGGPKRGWVQHMRRDPRVTLLLMDPAKMFRWAQIQGRLAETSAEGADEHIEHLSHRYTGSGGTPWERLAGYSRAVRLGNSVWVSGTTASDEQGHVHGDDAAAQTRYILRKIEVALQSAGASLADVVRTRIYVVNLDDWESVARVHG